jgi:LmbE family N-acetylglucosaminyl deacetylase
MAPAEEIVGKILFIGAHPDDVEIGCGGTAAKYAEQGNSIAFAVATREEDLQTGKKRTRQATNSAKLVNLSVADGTLFFGDLADGSLAKNHKLLREWLKRLAKLFKPETVFFHRKDGHTDHDAIYAVARGVFNKHNVLLYNIPRAFPEEPPFRPTHSEDISDYINLKVAMCACHKGQDREYISQDSVKTTAHYFYQRAYGRHRWRKSGYAEWFRVYASRSPLNDASQERRIPYTLRVSKGANGAPKWMD